MKKWAFCQRISNTAIGMLHALIHVSWENITYIPVCNIYVPVYDSAFVLFVLSFTNPFVLTTHS